MLTNLVIFFYQKIVITIYFSLSTDTCFKCFIMSMMSLLLQIALIGLWQKKWSKVSRN